MIELNNLTVKYRTKVILDNINYNFENKKYILYGQNGSGKSTLLKAIAQIIKYSGDIKLKSKNIFYLPEKLMLPKNIKVMDIFQTIMNIEGNIINISYYMNRYNLENIYISQCSKGMLQKIGIILSFIVDYDIGLFDEPLEGLDELSKEKFINDLKEFKENKTIILALHESVDSDFIKLKMESQKIVEI